MSQIARAVVRCNWTTTWIYHSCNITREMDIVLNNTFSSSRNFIFQCIAFLITCFVFPFGICDSWVHTISTNLISDIHIFLKWFVLYAANQAFLGRVWLREYWKLHILEIENNNEEWLRRSVLWFTYNWFRWCSFSSVYNWRYHLHH